MRRALFPIVERSFTYDAYDSFLARLASADVTVVPLRDFAQTSAADRAVVALRHDVDESLDSALQLARREHAHGLRATYYVLHTAAYWRRPNLIESLRTLQDALGHEVGWHNDLVTVQCVFGEDAPAYFARELERLRGAGIAIVGSASHGSSYCYRFGYHNNYLFSEFQEIVDGFPQRDVVMTPKGRCEIPHVSFAGFGLEYEAYHLDDTRYFSDTASSSGHRWHPAQLDVATLKPGDKAIVLVHPCHWDASFTAKLVRFGRGLKAGKWKNR
jgi:hypothetical protein